MQIPSNNSSSTEGVQSMSGSNMPTTNDTGSWSPADELGNGVAPGVVTASLAPSIPDAPQTLAEALPTVDDDALSEAILPQPPAPSAEFEFSDLLVDVTHDHVEEEVVLIDELDVSHDAELDASDDSEEAHPFAGDVAMTDDATDETTPIDVDEQENATMTISDDTTDLPTLATPEDLIADVLHSAEALEGSLADVLADSDPHPEMEYVAPEPAVDPQSAAKSHSDFNAAVDEASELRRRATEVLNQSQIQAQKLLDSAQRRAAATVSQSDDQSSRVIESARERAVAIVAAATTDLLAELPPRKVPPQNDPPLRRIRA